MLAYAHFGETHRIINAITIIIDHKTNKAASIPRYLAKAYAVAQSASLHGSAVHSVAGKFSSRLFYFAH